MKFRSIRDGDNQSIFVDTKPGSAGFGVRSSEPLDSRPLICRNLRGQRRPAALLVPISEQQEWAAWQCLVDGSEQAHDLSEWEERVDSVNADSRLYQSE